jgi:anti-anti-sigma factor
MAAKDSFHYEVTKPPQDQRGDKLTTIKCHGSLTSENTSDFKVMVKSLIARGGRIVIDLGDLIYIDSAGLGALVGLKVSAMNQGHCQLEFVKLTPRTLELLRITRLTRILSS